MLSPDEVSRRIATVRAIYLLLSFGEGVAAILAILGLLRGSGSGTGFLLLLVAAWADFLVYYGLEKKKEWVLALTMWMASITLCRGFLSFVLPVMEPIGFVGKGMDAALVLFGVYQLWLFQRQEVRDVLGAEGTVII